MKNKLKEYIGQFIEEGFLDRNDKLTLYRCLKEVELKVLKHLEAQFKHKQQVYLNVQDEKIVSKRLLSIQILEEICQMMMVRETALKLQMEEDKSLRNKYRELKTITWDEKKYKLC